MGAYDRDFHAWAMQQAELLRSRSANAIDWENLAEEIESLGRQQRSEVRSRMVVLLQHLLKWRHQAGRRGRSWLSTIAEQRDQIEAELEDSPSLAPYREALFLRAYRTARIKAATEPRSALDAFPPEPPFTLEQALDPDWLPDAPEDQSSTASKGS